MKNIKNLKNRIAIIIIVALFLQILMPLSIFAQEEATPSNIDEIFEEEDIIEEDFRFEDKSEDEEVATLSNVDKDIEENENIEEPEEQEENFYIKESTPSGIEENEILLYEQVATLSNIEETTPSNAEEIIENINVEDLAKTWSVDGITSYCFDIDGNGTMILPEHRYPFRYIIEENKLIIKFEDNRIKEVTFIVLIKDDELILEKIEKTETTKFILKKVND